VTRSSNKTPHAELLRQAKAKVNQQFGGKQRQESLIISNEPEDPPGFSWNGLHVVTTIELNSMMIRGQLNHNNLVVAVYTPLRKHRSNF